MKHLLDAQQWQRLHRTVCETLPWFMEKGLFHGSIGILRKIASSSLHELYQIRSEKDWDAFTKGFPAPLPVGLVLNFANGTRAMDWPFPKGSTRQCEVRDKLAEALSDRQTCRIKWTIRHEFFGIWDEVYALDFDPMAFGGIINVSTNRGISWNGQAVMCGDNSYIPCTVGF